MKQVPSAKNSASGENGRVRSWQLLENGHASPVTGPGGPLITPATGSFSRLEESGLGCPFVGDLGSLGEPLLCPETGPATQTFQGLPSWGLESSLL